MIQQCDDDVRQTVNSTCPGARNTARIQPGNNDAAGWRCQRLTAPATVVMMQRSRGQPGTTVRRLSKCWQVLYDRQISGTMGNCR